MSASTFTVTSASDHARLGSDRRGSLRFTAVNSSPRVLRGLARVVPLGDSRPDWFSIDGDLQRSFPPGRPQDFDVMIQVPNTANAGEHRVRLDVVGVENPDADYGRSPDVVIVVSALPGKQAATKGYLAAAVGALAGGIAGALVGTLPAALFLISTLRQAPATNPNASIGDIFAQALVSTVAEVAIAALLGILGLLIGVWIGPFLGAFVALRARKQNLVGLTVGLLVVFQLLITAGLFTLLIVVGNAIKSTGPVLAIAAVLALIDLIVPAVLARGASRLIRLRQL